MTPAPVLPSSQSFLLGINEALAVPRRMIDQNISVARLEALLQEDATYTKQIGARLVRGHTASFPFASMFSGQRQYGPDDVHAPQLQTDLWVKAAQAHDLEPILMVSPWPANQTANYTTQYVPPDMAEYTRYVQAMVERYDGDGVEDMPGLLRPVIYWEVDNEPDLKNTLAPRGAQRDMDPATFCTPAEYAQVLIASAEAIRGASTTAKVLNGGFYRPHAEGGQAYMREVFAVSGAAEAIDILSLHTYHDDQDGVRLADGVRSARAIVPNKPVWVTETSVTSEGKETWMDEEYQARMVVALVARAAAEGAGALLWHTLADPPPEAARNPFSANSLLRTLPDGSREPKPAGQVYQQLAKLLETNDLSGASYGSEGLVQLRGGGALLYAGTVTAPTGGINLRTGVTFGPGESVTAPAFLNGS